MDTTPDEQSIRCAACGRHVPPRERFCSGCGRATSTPPVIGSSTPADQPSGAEPSGAEPDAASTTASGPTFDLAPTGVMASVVVREIPGREALWSESGRPGALTCASCGAGNVVDRVLCGGCGLDLATLDPQLTVEPSPADDWTTSTAPTSNDGHAHAIAWWVPALAGIGVMVAVAAAIVGLGLGPFAPPTDVPPAEFESATYPGEPGPLVLTDIATLTSRSARDGRTFTPDHLVDGDPTTSWHGDADALPEGTDEKVDLFLEQPAWVTAVVVDNGDQQDADAYASTSRVQRAMLIFDGDVQVPVTLLDQGLAPQIVELDEPLLSVTVRLEVLETVAGTELEEVALTRLELLGFDARGDDVTIAEQRAALVPAAGAITLPV